MKARRRRARDREAQGDTEPVRSKGGKATVNNPRVTRQQSMDGRGSPRRGPGYERFCRDGWPGEIASAAMSVSEVARQIGVAHGTVSRWMAAWTEDLDKANKAQAHERSPDAAATLDDFAAFRARYFRTPAAEGAQLAGVPYLTPPFHDRWVKAIEYTESTGGRQIILSPPRHGKTDLLTHVCIWLICRKPNIRIMWVGLNDDIAALSVELVKDELENNELLRTDFCGPDEEFKPGNRSGRPWSSHRFTVATRTISARSPTMVAIGRGGSLLSRDADLIVVDDIIDHKSVQAQTQREADSRWVRTQLSSRKMKHTGLFVIGSRQHHEDLYSMLLDNPIYEQIVEQAHDPTCSLPDNKPNEHVDCVLFPDLNPYDYLLEQRADLGDELFEMVYQNNPSPEGIAIFDRETINACKNAARRIGDLDDYLIRPDRTLRGLRLIAGLDPASSGYQASVLWGLDVESGVRFLIDIDNTKGGGLPAAEQIIADWYERYRCCEWVIEENGFQGAIRQSRTLIDYAHTHGINLVPHFTTRFNKADPAHGVTGQAQTMRTPAPEGIAAARLIDLPYGDEESRTKVDDYARQLLSFTGESFKKNRARSDILMAGWFPEQKIRDLRQRAVAEIQAEYRGTSYSGRSRIGEAFWRQ